MMYLATYKIHFIKYETQKCYIEVCTFCVESTILDYLDLKSTIRERRKTKYYSKTGDIYEIRRLLTE